jgi:hypothetical protein
MVWIGRGGKSAAEIADEVSRAASSTRSHVDEVSEPAAESATKKVACKALDTYSSKPAGSLTHSIRKYAENQRFLAGFGLNEIDPEAAKQPPDSQNAVKGVSGSALFAATYV